MKNFRTLFLFFVCLTLTLFANPKIYDCFIFYNELELLAIRLEELENVVDKFVLVEATLTHSGQPKPLYFQENRHLFEKYTDKIISIVVDDFPPGNGDKEHDYWERENYQREAIRRGLIECKDEDIILLSDVDEIPREESIYRLREHFAKLSSTKRAKSECKNCKRRDRDCRKWVCGFNMRFFQFYINTEGPLGWPNAAKAFPFWVTRLKTLNYLRLWHLEDHHLASLPNAGFHFTSVGDTQFIRNKWLSWAEGWHFTEEYKMKLMTDPSFLENEVKNLYEFYDLKIVPIDSSYPKRILRNLDYYDSIGWIRHE